MMPSLEDLLRDALSLPPSDRAALAGALLGSLDEKSDDDDAESLWSAEIEGRVQAFQQGHVEAYPTDDVFAEVMMLSRLPRGGAAPHKR